MVTESGNKLFLSVVQLLGVLRNVLLHCAMPKYIVQCPDVFAMFQILQLWVTMCWIIIMAEILNLKSDQERQEQEQDHQTSTNLKSPPPYGRGLISWIDIVQPISIINLYGVWWLPVFSRSIYSPGGWGSGSTTHEIHHDSAK